MAYTKDANGNLQYVDDSSATAGGNPAYNPWGFPGAPPNYMAGWNPSMATTPTMQALTDQINPDQRGLDAYRQQALRTGPSAWAQLSGSQQDQSAIDARNNLGKTVAGRTAQADSSLAMKGGLDSGARERIAKNANSDYLNMSQDINKNTAANKMQIGINDEQNRISQLGALPGMENTAAQVPLEKAKMIGASGQFDVGQQTGESTRSNAFNLGRYNSQMSGWGAGQQANATANSGKK